TLLASNGLAVGLAASGFGVWSLAAYFLASTGFRSLALWVATPWRPGWRIDRGAFGDLWQFSSRLAAFNALNYWARNADNLLIGRFVGTAPLAYYNRAYNLMLLPVGLVASVTSRVMFPALSRLHEDQEQVKRVYLRATGLIALVTFPAMIGLLVVANPFILSVYGERWRPVVPILQILCIPSIVQCLTRTTGWIFQSQGRADWMFRWGVVSTVTVIVSFFIGLPWGVKGVSVAYACWTVLMASPSFSIAGRLIGVTLADVARSVIGVATASAAMAPSSGWCWSYSRQAGALGSTWRSASPPAPSPTRRPCTSSRRARTASSVVSSASTIAAGRTSASPRAERRRAARRASLRPACQPSTCPQQPMYGSTRYMSGSARRWSTSRGSTPFSRRRAVARPTGLPNDRRVR